MPYESQQQLDETNRTISRVLTGLNDTASNDQQRVSRPNPPAAATEERVNQLPSDEAERAALAEVARRIGGGK